MPRFSLRAFFFMVSRSRAWSSSVKSLSRIITRDGGSFLEGFARCGERDDFFFAPVFPNMLAQPSRYSSVATLEK